MAEDSPSTKLIYFVFGAGIGAAIALLFAPKSGRELREDIADVTKRGAEYTQENVRLMGAKASELYNSGREKVSELYDVGREKTNDLIETSREAVTDQRKRVAAAIDAGKRAYQDKKTEIKNLESTIGASGGQL